jgi:Cys-tRNA(Pro)/Cys-tRNA(Cys) deacylase
MKTNVMRQLDAAAVNYEVKLHSRQVFTSEDAAEERGVRISQIVKTMLLRLGGGECIAALIPGDRQLDTKQLRQLVGQKNVAMLPRDEVQSVSGYVPGAVSPIGLRRVRRVIVDEHVLDEEFVDISAGRPDAGIELRCADLVRLLNPTIASISRAPSTADEGNRLA